MELPTDVEALIPTIAAAIKGTILGTESTSTGAAETRIATAALHVCFDYAAAAPIPVLQEAAIRLAGWLYGTRPHATEQKIMEPSGTSFELTFANQQATANGLRASGASSNGDSRLHFDRDYLEGSCDDGPPEWRRIDTGVYNLPEEQRAKFKSEEENETLRLLHQRRARLWALEDEAGKARSDLTKDESIADIKRRLMFS